MKRFFAFIVWCVLVLAGCESDRGMPAETQTAPARTEVEDNASEAVRGETWTAVEASAAAQPPVPAEEPVLTTGTLTVRFETTAPAGGKYAEKHVQAVWVEKADGTFVRTLNLWADRRARELAQWAAKTADRAKDVQARTGATQTAYGTYTCTWDGTDAAGGPAPDGDYVIRLELTNDNANRNIFHRAARPFTKGPAAQTQEPVDEGGFKQVILDWKPL